VNLPNVHTNRKEDLKLNKMSNKSKSDGGELRYWLKFYAIPVFLVLGILSIAAVALFTEANLTMLLIGIGEEAIGGFLTFLGYLILKNPNADKGAGILLVVLGIVAMVAGILIFLNI
jgi:hypothetical protein